MKAVTIFGPNIWVISSRRKIQREHAACMGEKRNAHTILKASLNRGLLGRLTRYGKQS
jgi:hypothetical protein